MRCFLNLLVPVMILVPLCGIAARAQGPTYNRGRTPSAVELRTWDTAVGYEGKELPPGRGTPQEGAAIYAQKCAACHGPTGTEAEAKVSPTGGRLAPPLVGAKGTLQWLRRWPFATTIWDYVNKTMPLDQEGSLSADEVYALTAVLLYRNDLIRENEVMDAKSLPKVQMPNRNGFVPTPWPDPDLKSYRARCRVGICP